jgi:hypothetical protein
MLRAIVDMNRCGSLGCVVQKQSETWKKHGRAILMGLFRRVNALKFYRRVETIMAHYLRRPSESQSSVEDSPRADAMAELRRL